VVSTLNQSKKRGLRRRRGFRSRLSLTEFLVFLFPLLFFLIILYGMLGWTFYVSFANWKGTAPNFEFAGLKWYKLMFGLGRFQADVMNNLKWLILGVVPTVVIALFIAYLFEIGSIRGVENYARTLILYPVAMSFIVTGTIWSWMYQPDKGVFNTILRGLGLGFLEGRFITNPSTATYWLIIIFVWQYLGFSVIILQSSFRTTELQEMIEAAIVDGASRLRILLQVIVPNIRGGILILMSLLLISSLKVFDIVYIVTFGGPGFATDVLAFYMLIATFQQHLVSLGAGIGVIIFILAFIIVIPYTIYAFRKWFE
jgi:ABC-type sugar transport system permease subunit